MTEPDTLLVACRAIATAAGLPWALASRIYKAAQDDGVLASSKGRNIWFADPRLGADFLICLANRDLSPKQAEEVFSLSTIAEELAAFEREQLATGKGTLPRTLRDFIAQAFVNEIEAVKIAQIVFHPERSTAVVSFCDGSQLEFKAPGNGIERGPIFTHAVIDGALIGAIGPMVNWRLAGPPYRGAPVAEA